MKDRELREYLSRQLRRRAYHAGLDQRSLAEKAGLNEMSVSRYLNCERTPDASSVRKLAKALDCTADDLIMY